MGLERAPYRHTKLFVSSARPVQLSPVAESKPIGPPAKKQFFLRNFERNAHHTKRILNEISLF
jgi:hypothetical protein